MAKTTITVRMSIEGARETLRALSALPKDANQRLRDETLKLAETLAAKAKAEGMSDAAPQSPLVARTVKAVRDRVPVVQAGGSTRLGRNRVPAYKLLFGSIFGSNSYRQFHRPHAGQDAYWFFPVIEQSSREISNAWNSVVTGILRDFSEGGT